MKAQKGLGTATNGSSMPANVCLSVRSVNSSVQVSLFISFLHSLVTAWSSPALLVGACVSDGFRLSVSLLSGLTFYLFYLCHWAIGPIALSVRIRASVICINLY